MTSLLIFINTRGTEEVALLGFFLMDHHASGQHSQPGHTSSFQWLSFAYQGLREIPYETILTQTDTLEVLDLSYNLLDEYPFLNNQEPTDQTAT